MKVVLLGYMASGKSSLGKLLAKELGLNFIDLDQYIEDALEQSIPSVFAEKGEIFFRKTEHSMLRKVLDEHDNFILSTGGGTPCYSGNMDLILQNSDHSIYLQLTVPALVERIKNEKEHRPLVKHLSNEDLPEFVGKHLFERSPFYGRAQHVVVCDGKDLDTLIKEVKALLL